MSKFMEAIRRLFSRKGSESATEQNDVQKAPPRAPRMYDEVTMGSGGGGPTVEADSNVNDVQNAPKRAPRQYDEVDINGPPKEDGTVQVK